MSGGAAVFNFLSLLIITPVVAFYILVDWNRMISELDSWLPLDHRDSLRTIAREINDALAGFIRGQSIVCLFLGLWYGVGLTLIGLDFGFLIGVLGGLLSFVPYVGSLTALLLSLGVALVQGWPSLTLFFLALAVVGVGQFLEGNVLSPKLVGESDWASPGLVDVCAAGLRAIVRLPGTPHRRSDRGGDRRCEPPSHRASTSRVRSIEAARPRRADDFSASPADVSLAPFDEFRTRRFSPGALQPRGAESDRALAELGGSNVGHCRAGGGGKKPPWNDLGSGRRRYHATWRGVETNGASRPALKPAPC